VTVSVFGVVYTQIDIDHTATLSVDDARAIFENISGTPPVRGGHPVLTILPTLDGRYALTYLATMQNAHTYFVDAHTGHVLRATDERTTESEVGSGQGVLGDVKKVSVNRVAGTFRTQDQLRPAEILTLDTRGSGARLARMINGSSFDSDIATDSDNTWTDAGVVDAHVHIGWTYDYFLQRHGWAGLDGQDSRIFDAVNEFSVLPNNAFFIRAPFGPEGLGFMAFGATAQETPFTVLDVAAHEFMHGVTSFSAGLQSRLVLEGLGPTSIVLDSGVLDCNSTGVEFTAEGFLPFWCSDGKFVLTSRHGGAINEAFSDVFGAAVEFFFQEPGSGALQADYLTGEDLPFGPIRRLDSPQALPILDPVRYPDHFSRRLTFPILIVEGTQESPTRIRLYPLIFLDDQGNFLLLRSTDNGGVHWNATILGHAFYLAIEGGQNATSGLSVAGVGATNRRTASVGARPVRVQQLRLESGGPGAAGRGPVMPRLPTQTRMPSMILPTPVVATRPMIRRPPMAAREVTAATTRRVTAAEGIMNRKEIDTLDAAGIDAVVGMANYTSTLSIDDPAV
jgi:hypothetical protein